MLAISKFKHIPHNRLSLGSEEKCAAERVLTSGWIAQGVEVENFEDEFCDFLGIPRGLAVAVSSGTAALYLALLSLEANDKTVAMPAYTCTALRNATAMAGGYEQFIDSSFDTPNMRLSQIHSSSSEITIIPHMYGIPQAILATSSFVIEDCAQSLGATVNDEPVGLQGDIGIFSFYATKLITSGGQGGMIVSTSPSIIEFLKDYRTFDQKYDGKRRFNFQMTDIQAAIGRVQLRKLPAFLKRRAEIYDRYKEAQLPLLDSKAEGIVPVRYRAMLRTTKQKEILLALDKVNVKATIPLQSHELLGAIEQFPVAFQWTQNIVSLPIYPTLSDEDVERITAAVLSCL